MDITLDELKRIAQICMLDFTDEEYEFLKQSLKTTIEESSALFDYSSRPVSYSDSCDEADVFSPNLDALLDLARKNFGICVLEKPDKDC